MSNSNAVRLSAVLVANQLDIKGIRSFLEVKPLIETPSELMISYGALRHQFYFNFGVIVFSDHTDDEIKVAVKSIGEYLKNPATQWLREDYTIESSVNAPMAFEFDRIIVDHLDPKVFRITMWNLAQSVALDHYNQIVESLLSEVKGFTRALETKGKLSLGRKDMLKFIGRALGTKNEIADNVYVFDAPEMVWDDEFVENLNQGLRKQLDLRIRFNEIEYTLRTISENLDTFREIYNQRENSLLEWIIIALILVEVFDLIITRLF